MTLAPHDSCTSRLVHLMTRASHNACMSWIVHIMSRAPQVLNQSLSTSARAPKLVHLCSWTYACAPLLVNQSSCTPSRAPRLVPRARLMLEEENSSYSCEQTAIEQRLPFVKLCRIRGSEAHSVQCVSALCVSLQCSVSLRWAFISIYYEILTTTINTKIYHNIAI